MAQAVADESWKTAESIYEFTVNNIKGEPVSLEEYKGHVCIIVNVASRCGHTKSNYEQLVQLHEDYGESKGLKVLAFPCNQFGAQEPGDAEKICSFIENYNVQFDMFEKINVNGPKAVPLYHYLKHTLPDPKAKGKGNAIKWNFTKFVIDQYGKPVKRFASSTKPLNMLKTLEEIW
ncbi:PREDICTED: phospholipid hydroperoxide glutathione peroxidase, mitochondrial-like [Nicrophorus vespilloides]|uniref:Glutathione peroxidase n=1 Tax=Nicrophorus vespilloides TaxID=110193 RepID=A0ABM1N4X3_NICVS|nr:PREDICTED: phospholipid hydroperoxide glutathione peroxidase, mitochondrial-like [Nicrophorus vespilloides]